MRWYLLLLLVSVLTCAGQLCQKQAAERWKDRTRQDRRLRYTLYWLFLACLLLGLGMLAWLRVLQQLPVSMAYPMLSFNFVLVVLAARLIFKERVSLRHWCGVGVICLGILMMGLNR